METLLSALVEVLRLIPAALIFFIPALLGMALLKERGEGYKTKAYLVFILGFGAITVVHLMIRSVSALQMLAVAGISLLQIAIALLAAAYTVYKLAD